MSDVARTALSIRLPVEVHDRLREAADERCVSVGWLINRAVVEFLDRLIPVDEVIWTRPKGDRPST